MPLRVTDNEIETAGLDLPGTAEPTRGTLSLAQLRRLLLEPEPEPKPRVHDAALTDAAIVTTWAGSTPWAQ